MEKLSKKNLKGFYLDGYNTGINFAQSIPINSTKTDVYNEVQRVIDFVNSRKQLIFDEKVLIMKGFKDGFYDGTLDA